MIDTAIVIAKQPITGRVKTRLSPPLTLAEAAAVADAALRDTVETVQRVPARRHVLAFEGAPGRWLPSGWDAAAQPHGSLDQRLAAAFAVAGRGTAVLVGMDTPQLTPGQLSVCDFSRYDACLGLAPDGGYWAIGLRDASLAGDAISGVPMSTAHTGAEQLRRLHALGLRVQLLDELEDVDSIGAARSVAALAPYTRFAAVLASLLEPAA